MSEWLTAAHIRHMEDRHINNLVVENKLVCCKTTAYLHYAAYGSHIHVTLCNYSATGDQCYILYVFVKTMA